MFSQLRPISGLHTDVIPPASNTDAPLQHVDQTGSQHRRSLPTLQRARHTWEGRGHKATLPACPQLSCACRAPHVGSTVVFSVIPIPQSWSRGLVPRSSHSAHPCGPWSHVVFTSATREAAQGPRALPSCRTPSSFASVLQFPNVKHSMVRC